MGTKRSFILLFTLINIFFNANAMADGTDSGGCPLSYSQCISAADVNNNVVFYIDALPKDELYYSKTPLDSQILKWTNTGLYTTGISNSQNQRSLFKVKVEGSWSPWSQCPYALSACPFINCSANSTINPCMSPGVGTAASTGGQVIEPQQRLTDLPCAITNGIGLYGLISIIQPDGNFKDPNAPEYMESQIWPSSYFRTFAMTVNQSDASGNYFGLDATQVCSRQYDGSMSCITDTQDGKPSVVKGYIFYRLSDSYYQDNRGQYKLTVISGVYAQPGFLEKNYNTFMKVIQEVTTSMNQQLFVNSNFINLVKTLLTLFVTWTAFLFLTGSIEMNIGELIKRLVKFSIVSVLITPKSFEFFNIYLLSIFVGDNLQDGYNGIGSVVASFINNTTIYRPNNNMSFMLTTESSTPLTAYDSLLTMVSQLNLHLKILSLAFYNWYICYIPIIYIGIMYIVTITIRGVMLWFVATLKICLLFSIAPLFIMFFLFDITRSYFDNWLKQMMASSLVLIIASATIVLVNGLLINQLFNITNFEICMKPIFEFKIPLPINFNLQILKYWKPNGTDVNSAISLTTIFTFLVFGMLFNKFTIFIPKMCDILGSVGAGGASSMFDATSGGLSSMKDTAVMGATTIALTTYGVTRNIMRGADAARRGGGAVGGGVVGGGAVGGGAVGGGAVSGDAVGGGAVGGSAAGGGAVGGSAAGGGAGGGAGAL